MRPTITRWAWALSALGAATLGHASVIPALARTDDVRVRVALRTMVALADAVLTVAVQCLSRWYDVLGNFL
jgi:hypothetical protein